MSRTVSSVFRVPVRLATRAKSDVTCVRVGDLDHMANFKQGGCGRRHRTVDAARKCARSLSLGQAAGWRNERVEIRRAASR